LNVQQLLLVYYLLLFLEEGLSADEPDYQGYDAQDHEKLPYAVGGACKREVDLVLAGTVDDAVVFESVHVQQDGVAVVGVEVVAYHPELQSVEAGLWDQVHLLAYAQIDERGGTLSLVGELECQLLLRETAAGD